MSNDQEVTVSSPSASNAIDYALLRYPDAEVRAIGQIPQVAPTVETDETDDDEDGDE